METAEAVQKRALGDILWHHRENDYFLDVADDGYAIASSNKEVPEDEVLETKRKCAAGDWHVSDLTNCLGECVAAGCSCTRDVNPRARDSFLKTAAERIADLAAGKSQVSYASLGSGLLRFDFSLLELLLATGVPVTSVHLVDPQYEPSAQGYGRHRVALAQFSAWFAARGVDVYAHISLERFAFESRRTEALPVAVVQVDCSELTAVFEKEVKPALEEVLEIGGHFCALTSREGASGLGSTAGSDAWAEFWCLVPESGRMKLVSKMRFRPGELDGLHVGADEASPPVVGH